MEIPNIREQALGGSLGVVAVWPASRRAIDTVQEVIASVRSDYNEANMQLQQAPRIDWANVPDSFVVL